MAQKVLYTIDINADSSAAKKSIQDLLSALDRLGKQSFDASFNSQDFNTAAESAKKLSLYLQEATNVNTGKLNLTAFNESIKRGGSSLQDLTSNLLLAGSTGETAFTAMSNAIAQAEVPLKHTNKLLLNAMTTLKNTVKWELSSTLVHGLESALSNAVTYVEDLNSSLTDIRIVTGLSADLMAQFAVSANKAAKELSTTTKSYADAALIYYQQGDSDAQVAQKAAITIKAANASFNTSASEMSEYLTAVWNSYQVSSDQLEHYVDIMASLGAKTATSLEEIATAMLKVAATGNAVGVSMEQVSSIIATVSSVTRESAESIGTSYKTIFARIGDLKLGKTDEDGIGLGTVSSQLQSIGIDILDANGELKDMGDIITNLGDKWQTMNKATKTAVALAVAGKRQYTLLMALFENWDMYNTNLDIADNSDGSLLKMANTYAESYEAAAARAKASLETLYSSLINDKALISFQKGIALVADGFTGLVTSLGGIPGILNTVGLIATRVFSTLISSAINNVIVKIKNVTSAFKDFSSTNLDIYKFSQGINNLQNLTKTLKIKANFLGTKMSSQQRNAWLLTQEAKDENSTVLGMAKANGNSLYTELITLSQQLLDLKLLLILSEGKLTSALLATLTSSQKSFGDQIQLCAELRLSYEELQNSLNNYIKILSSSIDELVNNSKSNKNNAMKDTFKDKEENRKVFGLENTDYRTINMSSLLLTYSGTSETAAAWGNMTNIINQISSSSTDATTKVDRLLLVLSTLQNTAKGTPQESFITKLIDELSKAGTDSSKITDIISRLKSSMDTLGDSAGKLLAIIKNLANTLGLDLTGVLDKIDQLSLETGDSAARLANGFNLTKDAGEKLSKSFEAMKKGQKGLGGVMTAVAVGAMQALQSFTTMSNTIANWDPEASIGTKAGQITSIVGSLVSAWSGGLISGIIGTVASVIGIISGIWQRKQNEIKKIKEQEEEDYKSMIEDTEKEISTSSELAKSNLKLLNNYNELLLKKQKGLSVDADLITSALSLTDAYGLTGIAVASLSGEYEKLTASAKKAAVTQAESAITFGKNNIIAMQGNAAKTGFTLGYTTYGTGYGENVTKHGQELVANASTLGYGGAGTRGFRWYYDIPTFGSDAIFGNEDTYLNVIFTNTGITKQKQTINDEGISLNLILANSDILPYLANINDHAGLFLSSNDTFSYRETVYKALESTLNELKDSGFGDTEFFSGLSAIYSEMQIDMEKVSAAIDAVKELAETVLTAKTIGLTKGDWSDFDSLYNDLYAWAEENKESLGIDDTVVGEALRSTLDNIVSTVINDSTEYDDYITARLAIFESFKTDDSDENKNLQNEIYRLIAIKLIERYGSESITPAILKEISTLNVDSTDDVDAIAQSFMEGDVGQSLIKSAITSNQLIKDTQRTSDIESGKSMLKKNMSGEESLSLFNYFKEKLIGWGDTTQFTDAKAQLEEYNKFLALTYDEQTIYFENLSDLNLLTIYLNAKANKLAIQGIYDTAKDNFEDFTSSHTKTEDLTSIEELASGYKTRRDESSLVSFDEKGNLHYSGDNEDYKEWIDTLWLTAKDNGTNADDFLTSLSDSNYGYTKDVAQYVSLLEAYNNALEDLDSAGINLLTAAWNAQNVEINKTINNINTLQSLLQNSSKSAAEWRTLADLLGESSTSEIIALDNKELAKRIALNSLYRMSLLQSDTTARLQYMDDNKGYSTYEDYRTAINNDGTGTTIVSDEEYKVALQDNSLTLLAAVLILTQDDLTNIENTVSSIETLTGAYESYYKTNKFDTKTLSILKKLGINPSDINSIEDLDSKIDELLKSLKKYENEVRATAQDKLGINLTDEMSKLTWDKFASENKLDVDDESLQQIFELWKQAYWDAKTAGEDFNSTTIKNSIDVANSITKITNEITKLTEQTQKAKSVMDTLKEALTLDTPLTAALTATLTENGFTGNWKSKPSENIGTYGASVGNWALANSAELEKQRSYNTLSRLNNRDAYDIDNRPLEVQERIRESFATGLEDAFKSTDSTVLDNWLTSQHIDDAGKKILKEIFSESGSDQYSYADILAKFKEKMKELEDEQTDVWATFDDLAVAAIQSVLDEEKSAAAETVSTWEAAYKAIAEARAGLASGKSILETLYGDKDALASIISQYLNNGGELSELSGYLNSAESEVLSPKSATDLEYATSLGDTSRFLSYEKNGELSVNQNAEAQQSAARDAISTNLLAFIDGMDKETKDKYDAAKAKAGDNFDPTEYIIESLFGEGYLGNLTKDTEEYATAMAAATKLMIDNVSAVSANSYSNEQQERVNTETNVSNAAQINNDNNVTSLYGEEVNYDEATALQSAIENAQTAKYNGDEWESLSTEDRTLLNSYGIDFSSVDTAALATADALVKLANAALAAAEAQAKEDGYIKDEDTGNWYKGKNISAADFMGLKPEDKEGYTQNEDGTYSTTYDPSLVNTHITDTINNAQLTVNSLTTASNDVTGDTVEKIASGLDMTVNQLAAYSDAMEKANGRTGDFAKASGEVQLELARFAKVSIDAVDGWDEISSSGASTLKTLKESTKGTKEYTTALTSLTKNFKKAFGNSSKITESFAEEHMDLIERMIDGDQEAAEEFENLVARAEIPKAVKDLTVDIDVNSDGVANDLDTVEAMFDSFGDAYDNEEIGFVLTADQEPALNAMSDLLTTGKLTADEIDAALNDIGWDPEITYDKVPMSLFDRGKLVGYVMGSNGELVQVTAETQVEADTTVYIPKIKSAKKTGGGGGGYKKPSGSSGGGGGGGGGKKETKEKKKPTDEIERYHEINNSIEDLEKSLDKLSKLKDRAYGKNYVTLLQQEANAIEDQIDKQKELIDLTKEYLDLDRSNLAGEGGTFDANGNLNNYDELMLSWLDEYNAAVDKYNKGELGDAAKELLEQAEKEYEDRKELIDKYEESHDKYLEALNDLIEQQNELSAKKLEIIQYKVEYKIDINEDDLAILEYYQDKYDDDLDKQGEAMQNLIAQHKEYEDNLSILNNALAELNQKYQAGEITQADYQSGLADIQDQMLENLSSLEDVKDSIKELYENTLSKFDEEITNLTDKIDNAKSALESYVTLMGLMGRGKNYKELLQFYDAQYEVSLKNVEAQKAYLDALKEQQAYFENKQELTDVEKAQYEALSDSIDEVNNNLISNTQTALESVLALYENTVNIIFQELDTQMGYMDLTLSELADSYSYYTETQERYVTSSKQLYEVSKLNREIEDSIAGSTTKASKLMLKDLQAKINAQSESNRLTEYDILMNELQYQLALKKIALEETQNAKSKVQLTRDDNGNYIYRYTADEDKMAKAQQEYEDVLQQINELAANRVSELEQSYLDAQQSYYDKALEIALDSTLTEEERMAKLEELSRQFAETLTYTQGQYGIASSNLLESNAAVAEHYGATLLTTTDLAAAGINATLAGMMQNTDEVIENWVLKFAEGGSLSEALRKFTELVTVINGEAGTTPTELAGAIETIVGKADEAAEKTNDLANSLVSEMGEINSATEAWNAHAAAIDSTIASYENSVSTIQKMIKALADMNSELETYSATPTADNDPVTESGVTHTLDEDASNGIIQKYSEMLFGDSSTYAKTLEQQLEYASVQAKQSMTDWEDLLTNQDSGLLKSLLESIDIAMQNTLAKLNDMLTTGWAGIASKMLIDLTVTITAEFPNVEDSQQIADALETLVNRASQYASKTTKDV